MERDLLSFMYDHDSVAYVNLLNYFRDHYPNYNEISKDIKVALDDLVINRKLIRLSDEVSYNILGSTSLWIDSNKFISFEIFEEMNHEVKGKITLIGREYVERFRRDEKQDELNESFKKMNETTIPNNNKLQGRLAMAIAFTGIVTAAATIIPIVQKCRQDSNKIKADTLKSGINITQPTDSTEKNKQRSVLIRRPILDNTLPKEKDTSKNLKLPTSRRN